MLIQVARSWIEFQKGEAHEGQEEQWRNCRCAAPIVWHCSFRFPFDASAYNRIGSRPSKQHYFGSHSGWLHATDHPVAYQALIVTIVICPLFVSLWWIILVDPNTLSGANPHAEENIESHWYERAEQLWYRIFIGLVSVGCLLASLMGADQWALMLVCVLIAMLLILALSHAFVRFAHHE